MRVAASRTPHRSSTQRLTLSSGSRRVSITRRNRPFAGTSAQYLEYNLVDDIETIIDKVARQKRIIETRRNDEEVDLIAIVEKEKESFSTQYTNSFRVLACYLLFPSQRNLPLLENGFSSSTNL